jgi:HAD superfamily hydrolase (TIGR01549 family)
MNGKVILFDLWGTLIQNGSFPSPTKQTRRMLRVRMPYGDFVKKFESALMLKKYDDLNHGFEQVLKAFELEENEDLVERLVGMWNKNKIFAKIFDDTKETLSILKEKGYKIGIIGNNDCFIKSLLERFAISDYFDYTFFSYEIKELKGHQEFYQKVFDKIKADIDETNFVKENIIVVGDSLISDIEGAKEFGIRAILIDRKDSRSYEDKVLRLSDIPKLLEK